MLPALAGVGGFVDAVTDRKVRPLKALAATHIDDARIGRRHRQRTDGAGILIVEDGSPDAPGIGAFPNAAVVRSDVENVGLAGHPTGGHCAPAAEWPDHAPSQATVEFRAERFG